MGDYVLKMDDLQVVLQSFLNQGKKVPAKFVWFEKDWVCLVSFVFWNDNFTFESSIRYTTDRNNVNNEQNMDTTQQT